VVSPDARLSDLVKIISASARNVFPVVDQGLKLIGLVHMDKVRRIMFDTGQYETTYVKDLMDKPDAVVELHENLHEVFDKFDKTNQWNLPVVENCIYLGFLSKSSVLTRYRKEITES